VGEKHRGHRQPRPRRSLALPVAVLDALRGEARRRGVDAADLAEAILKNVVSDDLFAAVIDR
jgi:hypothetical protein